jgi:uncharacterized protein (DUF1330 family)
LLRIRNQEERGVKEMQKGYWIVRVDVTDQQQFKAYSLANADALKRHGARFLIRGGRFEVPEGTTRDRQIVVEFPSYQAAIDCWHSREYQDALKLRLSAAAIDLVIVEGWDGPQSS